MARILHTGVSLPQSLARALLGVTKSGQLSCFGDCPNVPFWGMAQLGYGSVVG